MNQLKEIFERNQKNAIDKWMHYFDIYDFWFKKYREKEVIILEIGVYQGGSLRMWKEYFGKQAKIFAIDINPECKQFEDEQTRIFIGSQEDRDFLRKVREEIPSPDILIDDGGHTMQQQIITFEELFTHIKKDGIYLCEDLHTSYWDNYGGGYKRKSSFIEYSKNFIDHINAWNSREPHFQENDFTWSAYGLHYYPSMLLIEKKQMSRPVPRRTGHFVIPAKDFPAPMLKTNLFKRVFHKLKRLLSTF